MTDGIIQKIFDKWEFKENEFYQDVIDSIKKELIQKIKQEFEPAQVDGFNMNISVKDVIQKLIGDNQE